ncbi:hypothetical protein GLOIN_2v1624336 [Rhizophagus clarus]|uniref:BTB domain-containing protein n=1 Tax=Rhizophagus clarus TaxID=94130 RepID=A0A8H3L0D0_9GLOM|nr:hypothetical protein GLOIN_2v1624336 [Rhizophagus clarus]
MCLEFFESLSRDFTSLLDTGEYSDVVIQVGQEPFIREFRVHSLILRTRSLYFRYALSNTWAKTKGNYIIFRKPNISPNVFEIILKYIYGASLKLPEISVKIILEILKAADELCISELIEHIQEFLLYNPELILSNLVLIHQFVNEYEHFTELQTFCLNTINQDPAIFFEAKDFITIDQSVLLSILKANNLIMKEIDIWNKIVEWGIAQDPILSHNIEAWTNEQFSLFRIIGTSSGIGPRDIDSTLIMAKHASLISGWMINDPQMLSHFEFRLLLRGTRDGFTAETFHKLCDNKGPTVTILRVKDTRELLGGYTPTNWDASLEDFSYSARSFIFSLGNDDLNDVICSRVNDPNCACYNCEDSGPSFGGAETDLQLWGNFKEECFCRCVKTSYERKIRESEDYFSVDEYEVFQVIRIF